MTLAVRGSVGFVFPFNYSELSQSNFSTNSSARAEGSDRDYQILFFRGFFSGGPNSNRGYPLRGVGPHDSIPYLSPAGQSAAAGGCSPENSACFLPTGGLSLWEANVELRMVVSGPFSTAFFCDAGDVSPFQTNLRFDRLHLYGHQALEGVADRRRIHRAYRADVLEDVLVDVQRLVVRDAAAQAAGGDGQQQRAQQRHTTDEQERVG